MGFRTESPKINSYSSTVTKVQSSPQNRLIYVHSNISSLTTFNLSGNNQNLINIGFYSSSVDSTLTVTVQDGDSTGTIIGENIPIITLPNYQMNFGEGGYVINNGSVSITPSSGINTTLPPPANV